MKTAPVKTDRDNGSFSVISLTESTKKLFQKGDLENKHVILTLSGADVRAHSAGNDTYTYLRLYRLFPGYFLRQLNHNSDGGSLWRLLCSLVHPKTFNI